VDNQAPPLQAKLVDVHHSSQEKNLSVSARAADAGIADRAIGLRDRQL